MIRDFLAGRLGVDAVAFVSMSAALVLGETLAGVVVAVMYAGGNVLEDFAVARAERDLKSLVDRAPQGRPSPQRRSDRGRCDRTGRGRRHRDRARRRGGAGGRRDHRSERDARRVRADRRADPGDAPKGETARSGTVNAGETFEMRATATAGREHLRRHRAHGDGGADRQGARSSAWPTAMRCCCFPVTLVVAGARMAGVGRSDPRARGAGRGDAVPADPGGAGGLHRRRRRGRRVTAF